MRGEEPEFPGRENAMPPWVVPKWGKNALVPNQHEPPSMEPRRGGMDLPVSLDPECLCNAHLDALANGRANGYRQVGNVGDSPIFDDARSQIFGDLDSEVSEEKESQFWGFEDPQNDWDPHVSIERGIDLNDYEVFSDGSWPFWPEGPGGMGAVPPYDWEPNDLDDESSTDPTGETTVYIHMVHGSPGEGSEGEGDDLQMDTPRSTSPDSLLAIEAPPMEREGMAETHEEPSDPQYAVAYRGEQEVVPMSPDAYEQSGQEYARIEGPPPPYSPGSYWDGSPGRGPPGEGYGEAMDMSMMPYQAMMPVGMIPPLMEGGIWPYTPTTHGRGSMDVPPGGRGPRGSTMAPPRACMDTTSQPRHATR